MPMLKYEKGTFTVVPLELVAGLNSSAQCVFAWLCFFANQDGNCFPSRETLAGKTGLSVRSLDRAMKLLTERGLIVKIPRFNGVHQTTNEYEIMLVKGATKTTRGGDKNDTQGATKTTHRTIPIELYSVTNVTSGEPAQDNLKLPEKEEEKLLLLDDLEKEKMIIGILRKFTTPMSAGNLHVKVRYSLGEAGFQVKSEAPAPYPDRNGRVDLLLASGDFTCAIELDYLTPRDKSIEKLRRLNVSKKIIVLRASSKDLSIPGIDHVIGLKQGTDREYGDPEINKMLGFLKNKIGIQAFADKKDWERRYALHLLNLCKRITPDEFKKRLESILSDEFKAKNCNSIGYLYRQMNGFIEPKKKTPKLHLLN